MEELSLQKKCFLSDTKKILKFEPEIDVEEIPVTKELYDKFFPKDDNVDYRNLRLSNIGSYSIAHPKIASMLAKQISEDMKSTDITVTDAFGNMGGMSIAFASKFKQVNTCEIVPLHCDILKNNLKQYKLEDKVNLQCVDYMDVMKKLKQDVIVFDPPWGGTDYKKEKHLKLGINNVNIICIINELAGKAKFIYMMVPPNYSFSDLRMLSPEYSICMKKLEPERGDNSKLILRIAYHKSLKGGNKTRRRRNNEKALSISNRSRSRRN